MKDLRGLDLEEMSDIMDKLGEKKYRAGQLFEWTHKRMVSDIDEMSNLSKKLRGSLKEEYDIFAPEILKIQESADGFTKKLLFRFRDGGISEMSDSSSSQDDSDVSGDLIESVLMKYKHGVSICVSSQVGCRMGCSFCASTMNGLERSLTAGEILSQVYEAQNVFFVGNSNTKKKHNSSETGDSHENGCVNTGESINHIIIMGMGEPFDNYDNVVKFIRLVSDEKGMNISTRNITVSTCGLPDGIRRLAEEELPVTLALSLHAPNDVLRKKLMPIAKAYSLDEVFTACRYYFEKTGRRITFEYSLINGVNDSVECAKELASLCKKQHSLGMPVHVNLIPLNEVRGREYNKSGSDRVRAFYSKLNGAGCNATIRREMGSDIDAACGQLRQKTLSEKSI